MPFYSEISSLFVIFLGYNPNTGKFGRAVGYPIVLMSADEVFDPAEFEGITDVDVYVVLIKIRKN